MDKEFIINELKRYKRFNKDKELAEFLGVKPQTLSTWKARNMFDKELMKLKFAEINTHWLETGEGDMFKNGVSPSLLPAISAEDAEILDAEVVEVPYVSQRVAQDPHLDIKEMIEKQEIETRNLLSLLGNFDGVQSVFRNAMEPMYHRGDLLLFRYVSTTGRLQQGTYIVDIDDMGAMLCMLIDNGQTIELSFLNPNFKSLTIQRNKLRSAATIVRHIRDERSLSIMPKKPHDMENINKMLAQHDAFLQQQKTLIAQHDVFLQQQNAFIVQQDKLIDFIIKK